MDTDITHSVAFVDPECVGCTGMIEINQVGIEGGSNISQRQLFASFNFPIGSVHS